MYQYYIRAPQFFQPIAICKGNIVVEKPNPDDVPRGYRKNLKQKIKSILYEIEWELRRFRKETNYDY